MSGDTGDADLANQPWNDVRLLGVEWLESGRDLVLRLRLPLWKDRPAHEARLVCRWARELKLALEFAPDHGGAPLSWEGEVRRIGDGEWSVAFDFASKGDLSLRCTEVEWIRGA